MNQVRVQGSSSGNSSKPELRIFQLGFYFQVLFGFKIVVLNLVFKFHDATVKVPS